MHVLLHAWHCYDVFPIAAVQFVNRVQLAFVVPEAGNHPHVPSVPTKQLAYEINLEQEVIAIQLIPFVVQCGEIF